MKKLIKISICLLAFLTLSACSKKKVLVSESNKIIIKGTKTNFSKQELFDKMKKQDFSALLLGKLSEQIAKKEKITDEDINKEIDNKIAELKKVYGDKLDSKLEAYGGKEKFRATLKQGVAQEKLIDKYIGDNSEKYIKEFKPFKAQIAYFDTQQKADDFIKAVKGGADFSKEAANLGYKTPTQAKVFTDKDKDLAIQIKAYVNDVKDGGLSKPIVVMTSQKDDKGSKVDVARYYVVNVLTKDAKTFMSDFIKAIRQKTDIKEIFSTYFSKYDLRIHDQEAYDYLSKNFRGIH